MPIGGFLSLGPSRWLRHAAVLGRYPLLSSFASHQYYRKGRYGASNQLSKNGNTTMLMCLRSAVKKYTNYDR